MTQRSWSAPKIGDTKNRNYASICIEKGIKARPTKDIMEMKQRIKELERQLKEE